MERSPLLDLPYIMPSQAQKHVTHNEAIRALDAIVQLAVLDRDRSAPPPDPSPGQRHIVSAAAEGGWAGEEGRIAAFQDGAWMFHVPSPGWLAWVEAEEILLVWQEGGWQQAAGKHAVLETLALNGAVADAVNRLAVQAPATLLNHDGGSHRLILNKADAGDTASLLFQTGFGGRAEFGLAGDDLWRVKLSADGEAWKEVIACRPDGVTELGGPLRLHGCTMTELPDPADAGAGAVILVTDSVDGAMPAYCDGLAWKWIGSGAAITN